jgi:alpha-ketoglutarate-dependent taurine dioxygenase
MISIRGSGVRPGSKTLQVKSVEQQKPKVTQIIDCTAVNDGKQLELTFADLSRYRLHTEWIKDASPSNTGPDFYRTSAADVWKLESFWVSNVEISPEGRTLSLEYKSEDGSSHKEEMQAEFLYACAPFVGKPLHTDSDPLPIKGTSSLLSSCNINRQAWMRDLTMPTFDAAEVATDLNAQTELLETMMHTGVALVKNVGPPESLERERVGLRMEALVSRIIGRMNQHPVRSTRYFVMQKAAAVTQGQDYDMHQPLSMHTDHTVYDGTPGYLQFMYQAEGSCQSKVCDGVALAEYMRDHYPEEFKLLTTVEITHSSRNNLYTPDGAPRNVADPTTKGSPFELVHTHPVIQLDARGQVEKVAQSETKRGVCALSFDKYESFMKAYKIWIKLCEDQRFMKHFDWPEHSMVAMNNWRILHGRASIPPSMARTMVGGYVAKVNFENRYRLLKQMQTEQANPSLNATWLTRLPNQILAKMVR